MSSSSNRRVRFSRLGRPASAHAGFTLIELLLVISIVLVLGVYALQSHLRTLRQDEANTVATQLKTLTDAANALTVAHYGDLIGTTTPTETGLTCTGTGTGRTCTATVATFIAEGLLPTTYQNITDFPSGAGWTFTYRILGTSPYYNVEGLVLSTRPWTRDSSILSSQADLELIGQAVRRLGADGGAVTQGCNPAATGTMTFCTSNGIMDFSSTDYPAITSYGQIGSRVGTGTDVYNVYLRRDGSLPMTGNLNMGGYSIYNIVNLTGASNMYMADTFTFGNTNSSGTISMTSDSTPGRVYVEGITQDNLPTGLAGGLGAQHIWAADAVGAGAASSGTGPSVSMLASMPDSSGGSATGAGAQTTGSLLTPIINNAGAGVVIGANMTSSAWGQTQGGYNYTANGALSVDDIYLRSIGKWYSQVAGVDNHRGAYLVSNNTIVTKPTCTVAGMPSATARIVVSPGDQVFGVYLQTGPTVATGIGNLTWPSSETVGEFSAYAVDNGTTWTVHMTSTNGTYTGNYGIAQVFCGGAFAAEQ